MSDEVPPYEIERPTSQRAIVRFTDFVDHERLKRYDDELGEVAETHPHVAIDLRATQHLSSDWIRRLQDLAKQAGRAGRIIAFVGVQPTVRKSADLLAASKDLRFVEAIDEVWEIP